MKPKYSFIIPTFNRPSSIDNLLKDLNNLNEDVGFEVVAFNDNRDQKTELLFKTKQKYPIKYLFSQNKADSTIARNECIKKTTGQWLIFLDDDVRIKPDFLQQVEKFSKKYQAFSFRMELPNKKTKTMFINVLLEAFCPGKIWPFFGHFVSGFDKVYKNDKSVNHLPGANMIFKQSLTKGIVFDAFIGRGTGYLDDANFSYSIKQKNYIKLWYISSYAIVHLQAPSGGYRQPDKAKRFYYYQNHKFYFFKKHFDIIYFPFVVFFNFFEAIFKSIIYKTNLIPIFIKALRYAKK